jgi:hypothetical protein
MSSVLMEVSGSVQREIPVPDGKYDSKAQLWSTVANADTSAEGLDIFAGTSTPTTYSATSSSGKDQDSDDRGT